MWEPALLRWVGYHLGGVRTRRLCRHSPPPFLLSRDPLCGTVVRAHKRGGAAQKEKGCVINDHNHRLIAVLQMESL
jgi:hypothetical protein